jgi:hypothetical protein
VNGTPAILWPTLRPGRPRWVLYPARRKGSNLRPPGHGQALDPAELRAPPRAAGDACRAAAVTPVGSGHKRVASAGAAIRCITNDRFEHRALPTPCFPFGDQALIRCGAGTDVRVLVLWPGDGRHPERPIQRQAAAGVSARSVRRPPWIAVADSRPRAAPDGTALAASAQCVSRSPLTAGIIGAGRSSRLCRGPGPFGQAQCFADPKPGAPQHDDQAAEPDSIGHPPLRA